MKLLMVAVPLLMLIVNCKTTTQDSSDTLVSKKEAPEEAQPPPSREIPKLAVPAEIPPGIHRTRPFACGCTQ